MLVVVIYLIFLIVFNMAAHYNNRLPHEEHKESADQCQSYDGESVLNKDTRIYLCVFIDNADDLVGTIPDDDPLVGSKNGGK